MMLMSCLKLVMSQYFIQNIVNCMFAEPCSIPSIEYVFRHSQRNGVLGKFEIHT